MFWRNLVPIEFGAYETLLCKSLVKLGDPTGTMIQWGKREAKVACLMWRKIWIPKLADNEMNGQHVLDGMSGLRALHEFHQPGCRIC